MANLLDSVENSIWHAFDHLALEGDGTAPKSKLKVGGPLAHISHGPRASQIGATYLVAAAPDKALQ
jgi:hypothetical protein